MEKRKNLCAMIPEELHGRVKQEQEALALILLLEQGRIAAHRIRKRLIVCRCRLANIPGKVIPVFPDMGGYPFPEVGPEAS